MAPTQPFGDSLLLGARCGSTARPAGLPRPSAQGGITLCGPSPLDGIAVTKGSVFGRHAVRDCSPYAQVALPGWRPTEAAVHAHQHQRSAGITPINNTYLPKPLMPIWGKTRELSPIELHTVPKTQCPDLLWTSKGNGFPGEMDQAQMSTVRPDFSPTIPIFREKYDVFRFEAGFLRAPNVSRGAALAPLSPLHAVGEISAPSDSPTAKFDKFSFDKSALGTSRIPVCKSWLA